MRCVSCGVHDEYSFYRQSGGVCFIHWLVVITSPNGRQKPALATQWIIETPPPNVVSMVLNTIEDRRVPTNGVKQEGMGSVECRGTIRWGDGITVGA